VGLTLHQSVKKARAGRYNILDTAVNLAGSSVLFEKGNIIYQNNNNKFENQGIT